MSTCKSIASVVVYFSLFCLSYAALTCSSGGALYIGSYLLSNSDEQYKGYTSLVGFKIGAISAATLGWFPASFITYIFKLINSFSNKDTLLEKVLCPSLILLSSFFLLAIFELVSLPLVNNSMLGCYKSKKILINATYEPSNPLCTQDTLQPTQESAYLFRAYYLGSLICMLAPAAVAIAGYGFFQCCKHRPRQPESNDNAVRPFNGSTA